MESDSKTPVFNARAGTKIETEVPLDKAIAIFDNMADRNDIAFGYADDGCFARAHLMCLIINAMGLTPKKAWAFEDSDPLTVKQPNGTETKWWYHVAAVLPVKMPDGAVQDMVFDPGLFDGPVSLQEWGNIMRAKPSHVQVSPFVFEDPQGVSLQYHPDSSMLLPEAYSSAVDTMSSYAKYQDTGPRTVFQAQSRQQFDQMQGGTSPSKGKTWQSAPQPLPVRGLADRVMTALSLSNS
jgi:hypothetical protein